MDELKPCPCCGCTDLILPDHEEAPVYCKTCWLRAVNFTAWNRRTPPASQSDELRGPTRRRDEANPNGYGIVGTETEQQDRGLGNPIESGGREGGSSPPASASQSDEALERLRIMAKQKLAAEMDSEDRENADWHGGYEHMVEEARAILPILSAREVSARAEGRREGVEEAAKRKEALDG